MKTYKTGAGICFVIVILQCFCVLATTEKYIYVYTQQYHRGPKVQVRTEQCTNLAPNAAEKVLSIDRRGDCAAFYAGVNCTGDSIEVLARSPGHATLDPWNFNYKTLSVGPCRDPCDEAVTGEPPKMNETADLVIFSQRDFKGACLEMKVKDCTLIPTKFTKQMLSVRTFDKCLQFYNNVHCKYPGDGLDSIEMRRGTPLHNDVSAWSFGIAKAVSHCSYKCDKDRVAEAEKRVKVEQEMMPMNLNEIFLYDEKDFKGNRLILNVTQCQDIDGEWEGMAVSAKTFDNQTCVAFYDKRGCEGVHLRVVGAMTDFSNAGFDAMARSIGPCSDSRTELTKVEGLKTFLDKKEDEKDEEKKSMEKASSFSSVFIIFGVVFTLAGVGAAVYFVRNYKGLRCRLVHRTPPFEQL